MSRNLLCNDLDELLDDLHAFAADSTTLMALPRIVHSWGYRSQSPA
jgi:hypothetical protein